MTLRRKLLVTVAVTIVLLVLGLQAVSQVLLLGGVARYEEETTARLAEQARATLPLDAFVAGAALTEGIVPSPSAALSLRRLDDPTLPDDFRPAAAALAEGAATFVQPLSASEVAGYALAAGPDGRPDWVLRVTTPRDAHLYAQDATRRFSLAIAAIGLAFGLTALLVLDGVLQRSVVTRFAELSRVVGAIRATGDLTRRVNDAGGDELSGLGHEVNGLLTAVEQAQDERAASQQALLGAFEQADREAHRRELVNEIARAINASLDINGIYKLVTDELRRRIECDAIALTRRRRAPRVDDFRWRFEHTWTREGIAVDLGGFLRDGWIEPAALSATARRAYAGGGAEYVADAREAPGHEMHHEAGLRSLIKAPIVAEGEVLGNLSLFSCLPNAFTLDDLALAEDVARHLAVAIRNAELYEEARREAERRRAVDRIARAVGATLDLEAICDVVVDEVREVITCDAITLLQVNSWEGGQPSARSIRRAWFSENAPAAARAHWQPGRVIIDAPAPFTDDVYSTGRTRLVRDTLDEGAVEWTALTGLRSLVKAPLADGDWFFGSFTVSSAAPGAFSDGDSRFLSEVAAHLSQAIRNAQLYSAERRRAEELAALNVISTGLTSSLQTDVLLDKALVTVGDLVGHDCMLGVLALDRPGGNLKLCAQHNVPPEFTEQVTAMLTLQTPDGECLAHRVAVDGATVLLTDFSTLGEALGARLARLEVKGIIGVPLRAQGTVLGVLFVVTREERIADSDKADLLVSIGNQLGLAMRTAQAFEELKVANLQTILALSAAVSAYDPYTSGHSEGVADLALAISAEMGLPPDEQELLRIGGLLHDVGKIGMPESVINKPSRLTRAEYIMVQSHPVLSAEIVSSVSSLAGVVPAIRHHHERYDGKGYPDGLVGESIPLMARLLAVADAYHAMTSERPYRQARAHAEAVAILREGAGTQWDARVVETFLTVLTRRAVG